MKAMKLQTSHGPLLVHPNYVLRVAGEPAALLNELADGATARHLAERAALGERLQTLGERLRPPLEAVVHGCTDKALGRAALNAKRSVFNLKAVREDQAELLQAVLGDAERADLAAYNEGLRELAALEASTAAVFEGEMAAGAQRLPTLWAQPRFQQAISYTQPELYRNFERLADAGATMAAKPRRKLEETFVQYLARCASKTSPLSAFTVMHVGRWSARETGWDLNFAPRLSSRVSFKGALLRQIVAPLLANYDLASQLFPLSLNQSAQFADGRVRFRSINPGNTAGGRSWGTGESMVELKVNSAISCIQHVYAARGWASMPAVELIAAVQALSPKLERAALEAFVARLYELNLLLPDTDDHAQADAFEWVHGLLQRLQGEAGETARAAMARIRGGLKAFVQGSPAQRATLTAAIAEHAATLRDALGAERHAALEHPSFFENCYLGADSPSLGLPVIEPFADALGQLMQLSPLTSFTQQARCSMADFFVARHGEDGVCDNVPAFIDAFDEVYGIGAPMHKIDASKLPPRSTVSAAYGKARSAFQAYLEPLLRERADVQLDATELARIVDLLPEAVRQRGTSQCFLGQLALKGERTQFVLNQILGGRSALMSRFLEVLDPASLAEVRDYLREGSDSGHYAELAGVFGFNANYHPQLADHELYIPPTAPNWQESTKLDIAKMRLVYDRAEHCVRIRNERGQDLDVWYQGFLMPALLPRIHRVLALTLTEGVTSLTLGTMVKMGLIEAGQVTRVPRVSLGDVVVERRQWILPLDLQPDAEIDALPFFEAMQTLQRERELPRRFFMRVLPLVGSGSDAAPSDVSLEDFDFRSIKPLYVDLDSPRLVRLMQRALKRNRFPLSLSEVLPRLDDQHVEMEGGRHVAELQFELSTVPVRLQAEQRLGQWHAVRIAYFDDDKRALLLGPVRDGVELLRGHFGIADVMLQPHWKHGSHVDMVFRCPEARLHEQVLPALRAILEPWLAAHPSLIELDPVAYEALSRQIGLTELEPGPYLPLLPNNSVTLAPPLQSRALPLAELVQSKERFLCDSLPATLDLLALKTSDADSFFLTLAAMLGMAATTYDAGGFDRGYVSFRSHAEFCFAAYDRDQRLRQRFDALDQRLAARLDGVLACVREGRSEDLPLAAEWRAVLAQWQRTLQTTAERHRNIVRDNYDALLADQTLSRLARDVQQGLPAGSSRQRIETTTPSQLSVQFQLSEGLKVQNSPEFIAYRNTVNFFYFLLPLLGVSPSQKFCLCHLVANSAERLSGISWREIVGLRHTEEELA